jgi:hypothetical protein
MIPRTIVCFLTAVCCFFAMAPARQHGSTDIPPYTVTLPRGMRPLPEPLPAGQSAPGFPLRGIKGWMWTPSQYLAEIPVLAAYKMNFLMNCYTSMCDIEHYRWGDTLCNRWWEPLPESKRNAYEQVVRNCQQHGIQFCFSMNPNLSSTRFPDPGRAEDVDALWRHYRWMQSLGVHWFNISLDDITSGIDAAKQATLVNEILRRLRVADPDAHMIFCPTYYWGDGSAPEAHRYLKTLAKALDSAVYVFWTGDAVVTPRITRQAAERYRAVIAHRMILWDNYPVNDNTPTMHLGPVSGRDPDLCDVIDGYMSNPLCPQNEINRVPMLTCADYAYNPRAYDPQRSIGQSILHLATGREQRTVLKELVEAYPGMLLFDKGTSFNPVRERGVLLADRRGGTGLEDSYVASLEQLLKRLRASFPAQFDACKQTLANDIVWLRSTIKK